MNSAPSSRTLRRAYLEWVEEQLEEFKDSIPRSDLLSIADDVVRQLRVDARGQYQLTEVLLTEAFDRHLVRLLKLPGYRSWRTAYLASLEAAQRAEPAAEAVAEPEPPPVIALPSRAAVSHRPRFPMPVARVG